jgi:hypothetical protein
MGRRGLSWEESPATSAQIEGFVRKMNRHGRHFGASANSIPDYCRPQNVKAFFDEIARCGGNTGCRPSQSG